MVICSQRTRITFWPQSSSFATTDARRPRRWPRPSMTTGASNMMAVTLALGSRVWSFLPTTNHPHNRPRSSARNTFHDIENSKFSKLNGISLTHHHSSQPKGDTARFYSGCPSLWSSLVQKKIRSPSHSLTPCGCSSGDWVRKMLWTTLP